MDIYETIDTNKKPLFLRPECMMLEKNRSNLLSCEQEEYFLNTESVW